MPRIADSITTYNASVNTKPAQGEVAQSAQSAQNGQQTRVATDINSLKSGQMIQGKIVSSDGESVQIALGGNSSNLLNAKLDSGVSVTSGRVLTFEVKSNSGGKLILSPLFTNLTTESTAFSALKEAGLARTDANMEMVATMMKEGMSVDKESLYSMHHMVSETGEMNPAGVVTLTKLGIPVTRENLDQLTQYQNAQGKITDAMMDIADSLANEYGQFLTDQDPAGALQFANSLLQSVGGQSFASAVVSDLANAVLSVPISAKEASVILHNLSTLSTEDLSALLSLVGTEGEIGPEIPEEAAATQQAENAGLTFLNNLKTSLTDTVNSLMGKTGSVAEEGVFQETASVSASGEEILPAEGSGKEILNESPGSLKNLSPDESREQVLNLLKDALFSGMSQEMDASTTQNVLNALSQRLSVMQDKNGAMELFRNAFGDKVAAEWNINPEELSEKTVKELYTKLLNQTERVLNEVKEHARPDSPVQSTVQNMQNNILFMNQMNHVFSYIQIPLRNMGEGAQGELYVYSRGKNHFQEDGTISALLHLDMPHLGPMDVYVTLTAHTNVNTNFYLADESSLDLIAQHIDELSARLEKKGYSMQSQFINRTDDKPMMQQIIEDHRDLSVIQSNSFDMRA